jgi:hypothetical protein
MSEALEAVKKLVRECSTEDLKALRDHLRTILRHPLEDEWSIDADTILTAIRRSSDLTRRGVRGIIAEAVFEGEVLPKLASSGWQGVAIAGDLPYDALLQKGGLSARVQIKLQRLEKGVPKLFYPKHYGKGSLYVVEMQKTRGGEKSTTMAVEAADAQTAEVRTLTVKTRPYRFGDFDILAVNMHPSSGDWRSFRYTLGSWLLPRLGDRTMVEIFQPVAALPNDVWTDDLSACLKWFEAGVRRQVLTELLHRQGGV